MKKIRVAILDDEINCVEKMKIVITQNFSNREMIIDEYTSKDKLLDNKACYDIILVDLELDTDGKIDEGMDFITSYREQDKDALMIIVTSHDELARDGYKVKAFGFVYKPKMQEELRVVFGAALDEVDDNRIVVFRELLVKKKERNERKKEVLLGDIKYCETYGRHLKVHLKNESFLIKSSMTDFLEDLQDDRFCLVHKSYIVNIKYVRSIDDKNIKLKENIDIPIGRAKRTEVEKKYWEEKMRRNK